MGRKKQGTPQHDAGGTARNERFVRGNDGNCGVPGLRDELDTLSASKAAGCRCSDNSGLASVHERNNGTPVAARNKFTPFEPKFGARYWNASLLNVVKRQASTMWSQTRDNERISFADDGAAAA